MKKNKWIICFFLIFFSFFSCHLPVLAKKNIPRITVHFSNTDLATCINTIIKLADSSAQISISKNIKTKITKSIEKEKWDLALKEILIENNLQLKKQPDGTYRITKANSALSTRSNTVILSEKSLSFHKSQQQCPADSLITLGYKYSTGANPYGLIGKCLKLCNVTPFQYMDGGRKALITWSYRGESGTVLVEDRSRTGTAINNSNFVVGKDIGIYEYTSVLGAKMIIPHIIIK